MYHLSVMFCENRPSGFFTQSHTNKQINKRQWNRNPLGGGKRWLHNAHTISVTNKWRWKRLGVGKEKPTKNFVIKHTRRQGRSDGRYIGIYPPKKQSTLKNLYGCSSTVTQDRFDIIYVHVWDINMSWICNDYKTYTPKSNLWLRPCSSRERQSGNISRCGLGEVGGGGGSFLKSSGTPNGFPLDQINDSQCHDVSKSLSVHNVCRPASAIRISASLCPGA